MTDTQATHQVLMIRPVNFAGNVQTSASNRFQNLQASPSAAAIQNQALQEFDAVVVQLRAAGVQVRVFADTAEPHTPDAIFPNNWVSFHADGTAVLYPMLAENRRQERRMDVLQQLSEQGFRLQQIIDLSHHEQDGKYLEGTGSLVLDRINRIAYACVSPRTDLDVLGEFAQRLDYELISFAATDANGVPIYHTNVLMSIGTRFAVLCTEVIAEPERAAVLQALSDSGHKVVAITVAQMHAFAGNVLELRTVADALCVAMSQSAFDAFSPAQRAELQSLSGPLIATAIPTIERLGGGSVRCMLAEIFLPPKFAAG
ncbi:MAG: citrulline utilization hydrolase CtlX [Steroidobacteraceae bacterium]